MVPPPFRTRVKVMRGSFQYIPGALVTHHKPVWDDPDVHLSDWLRFQDITGTIFDCRPKEPYSKAFRTDLYKQMPVFSEQKSTSCYSPEAPRHRIS